MLGKKYNAMNAKLYAKKSYKEKFDMMKLSLLSTRFSRENIIDYIYKHNMYVASKANKVRTLIGIDGTSSMGPAL